EPRDEKAKSFHFDSPSCRGVRRPTRAEPRGDSRAANLDGQNLRRSPSGYHVLFDERVTFLTASCRGARARLARSFGARAAAARWRKIGRMVDTVGAATPIERIGERMGVREEAHPSGWFTRVAG